MRKLYESTRWKRVLALALVFVMMFSIMGTSGYSVFAEGLDETGEEVVVSEPEVVEPEVTEDIQGPSPGEEEAEAVVEAAPDEEGEETEEVAELDEETEEEGEEPAEAVEETAEGEEGEEPAEAVDEIAEGEDGEEPAEAVEEVEEDEENEAEVDLEEATEEEPYDPTLIEEAAQIIEEDDGEPAPEEEAIEELPEEVLEEEIAMPAIEADKDFEDARVYVYAPEGAFPEGTTVEIKAVRLGRTQIATVAGAVEETVADYVAYDITFYDVDGVEAQPAKPVTVNIEPKKMAEPENLQVVHMEDSKTAAVVEAEATDEGLLFDAEHFSVYVVVATGTNARALVKFVNGETEVASMYVKSGDNMEQVIYDPGVGNLDEGVIFKGWTTDKPYTAASTAYTIDEIRTIMNGYNWASVKDADEEGGTIITYYAVFVKQYTINYLDESGVSLGMGYAEYRADSSNKQVEYTVNMSYTPVDDEHDFQGWLVSEGEGNIVSAKYEGNDTDAPYLNTTVLTIKGDVTLSVNAPEGHWLVFEQNGSGATYCAPQFVLSQDTTSRPRPDNEMFRHGYRFDGWYYGRYDADNNLIKDEDGYADLNGATAFEFGQLLTTKTTLYAKWTPNETAPYTVLLWTQNLDRTAYELMGSYVNNNGVVGNNIPFTFVENKDEDYVTGVGNGNGHYTGFCLTEESRNQQVKIKPEGDAVLNLYYDRIEYNFKFYLYRNGTQNNRYDYANNSGSGSSLNELVTWHSNQTAHPSANGYEIKSETVGGRTYHYFTISAYYGENISAKWPTYNKITGADGREAVSYVMMVGTKLKPNPTSTGSGTVKGIITVMNENILGATNDKNGNYVVVRFPDNYYNWRYHIWFETVDGEDYTGKPTRNYNGKTYYEDTILVVRSSNREVTSQNEPKYTGFDFVEKRGQNWNNTDYWTSGNNPTLYHLNYVYNRQKYEISYFDGTYFDGDNKILQSRSSQLLHESEKIAQGAKIGTAERNYVPPLPENQEGYVFEGWYLDEGCNTKYSWDTMPIGGIKVYAKWRQIQYRVFLHPNAGTDPTLNWGSENQEMNFRVSYGGKVSTPTGTRTGYAFVGWYTDANFKHLFNKDAFILNESTVTAQYDKNRDMTDVMDKWGNGATTNKDLDRAWITKKLDLYAKWRKVLDNADGISVIYDKNGGTGTAVDNHLYLDNAAATAVPAVTAPEKKQFAYWVLQKWNPTKKAFEDLTGADAIVFPGQNFQVLEENAKVEQYTETEESGAEVTRNRYTVQLRAEFVPIGEPAMTYIPWYKNDGTPAFHTDTLVNGEHTLDINKAVTIQPAPARLGYTFKGWAKKNIGNTFEAAQEFANTKANWTQETSALSMFLYYKDGTFYSDSAYEKAASKVAADETMPYQALFAVWDAAPYNVKFDANGSDGTMTDQTFTVDVAQALKANEFSRGGFDFAGWNTEANGSGTSYTDQQTVTNLFKTVNEELVEVTLYAQWTPKTVGYTVEYYYQRNGAYPQNATSSDNTRTAAVGSTVEVTAADQTPAQNGYVFDGNADNVLSSEVTANGCTLKVYFKQQFKVTYQPGEHGKFAETTTDKLDYGMDTPLAPDTTKCDAGYTFAGWNPTRAATVTADAVYVAQWAAKTDIKYTVEFYYQVNGQYPTEATIKDDSRTGTTGDTVNVTNDDKKPADGYTGYALDESKQNDWSGAIAGDGSLVLKVYFKQQFKVTYQPGEHGKFAETTTDKLDYGANTPLAPDTTQCDAGYAFTGWNPAREATVTANKVYVAQWAAKTDINYTVEYYYQKDGAYSEKPNSTVGRTDGTTGSEVEVTAADKTPAQTGYVFDEKAANILKDTVKADGSTVLKVYFKQQFTVIYNPGDYGTFNETKTEGIDYGANTPAAPAVTCQAGYKFAGWDKEIAATVTADAVYTATYEKITYAIIYHSNYKSVDETAEEAPDKTDDPATKVLGPDDVGFSTGLQKTIGGKTYKFVKWTVMPDGTGAEFKPGAAYNGEGAVLPQQDDANGTAGTASAVSTSAKTIRAMVATSSNGGTLNLYAQWEEVKEDNPGGGGNTPTPKDPDPTPNPDPTDDPEEPIDDPDTPLAPGTIDDEDEPIDDGDTPLAPAEEEDTEIDEEATPLTPFTGDERHTAVWGFVSLLSLAGIVVVARKRREE